MIRPSFCDWLEEGGFDPSELTAQQWSTLNRLYRMREETAAPPRRSPPGAVILWLWALLSTSLAMIGVAVPHWRNPAAWSERGSRPSSAPSPPPPRVSQDNVSAVKRRAEVPAPVLQKMGETRPREIPPAAPPKPRTADSRLEGRVRWVTRSGDRICLEDGTLWQPRPDDRETAANWTAGEALGVTLEGSGQAPYRIFNNDRSELIRARRRK